MSQPLCPKCSSPLKDDYGMATCSKCGSIVFVDMDGQAHFSEDEPARTAAARKVDPPRSELPASEPEEIPEHVPLNFDAPEAESAGPGEPGELAFPGAEHSLFDLQNPMAGGGAGHLSDAGSGGVGGAETAHGESTFSGAMQEPMALDGSAEASDGGGDQAPAEEPSADGGDFDMDKMLGYQDPNAESVDFAQPGDPLGTTDYANSEISQAKDGPLIFKILISGIDSKEMRESLRSALDDQRFGWNPNDLMSRISKGLLTIENVAPVKAVILINRIKRLPVRVRWEQYAITQME